MPRAIILLVDDDPAVRSSIVFSLAVEGFDVAAFASAEAMLAAGAAGADCDCLVFDQRLPGIDGLALLRRVRADGGRAPAIVITSNPSPTLRERVRSAGAMLVEKPLLSGTLAAAIRTLIAPAPGAIA